ncbi:hydroxymethylglutaryl-CoA lyase [Nocardioides sp. LHD-245]|uniref:hydroxymethylglutaryl-CoA lyase n=1 Tax=Nocardioides sp. LHD-245 TaxID=3051387 RepID=UPI0027DF0874|nr:hydroxymethylglutaryl-CoA lyase [Nocardioides sp. LHD-245]
MALEDVRISDCWARDGIQPEGFVPTAAKLEILELLAAAGYQRVELTSFTSPRHFPQFTDAAEVLTSYRRHEGVEYAVLIPNPRGLELMQRAQGEEQRVDSVTLIVAASESYNLKNSNRTLAASLAEIRQLTPAARADGLMVTGCVGTAWGCPIEGPVDPAHSLRVATELASYGVDRIMLGDTTGEALPDTAGPLVADVAALGLPVVAHFHDQRGAGVANALAAGAAGATWLDVSLGGTGGHPPEAGVQTGDAGNVCAEDLATILTGMGVPLGLDLDRLISAGRRAEEVLGRQLNSMVQRAGLPVRLQRKFA